MTVSYLNDTDPEAVDPADAPDGDTRPGPREQLGRYAELGGFTLTADANPWYAAADAIGTPEDARSASTLLAELRSRDISATRGAVLGLAPDGALSEPDTVVGLSLVVGVLQRVHGTAAKLRAEAYDADLDALTAATAGARWRKEQGVKLSWGRRRALRAQAKDLVVGKRARRGDLHEALTAAAAERADWAALASSGTARPAVPTDATRLTEAAQAVDELGQAVRALGRLLPGRDLETTPLADLSDLVDRLAADEGTLYRLPTLRSLRTALSELGLDALVDELKERRADREAAVAAYDRQAGTDRAEAVAEDAAEDVAADVAADAAADVSSDEGVDAEEAARQALAAGPRTEAVPAEDEPVAAEIVLPAQAESSESVDVESAAVEAEVEVEVEVETVAEAEAEVEVEVEPVVEVEAEPVAEVEAVAEVEVEVETVAEAEPVVEAEAEVETAVEVEVEPVAEEAEVPEEEAERPRRVRRPKKPALTPGRPVTAYTEAELTALVRWIDSDDVERTDDELLRAAMKELGFARLGPRIKEALGAAVSEARS